MLCTKVNHLLSPCRSKLVFSSAEHTRISKIETQEMNKLMIFIFSDLHFTTSLFLALENALWKILLGKMLFGKILHSDIIID